MGWAGIPQTENQYQNDWDTVSLEVKSCSDNPGKALLDHILLEPAGEKFAHNAAKGKTVSLLFIGKISCT